MASFLQNLREKQKLYGPTAEKIGKYILDRYGWEPTVFLGLIMFETGDYSEKFKAISISLTHMEISSYITLTSVTASEATLSSESILEDIDNFIANNK
jgi:hypothetical protein